MCTHQKRVFNKFSQSWIWVKCGKCHACQVEKANKRRLRIFNTYDFGETTLFVTLTYAPIYLPYLKPKELTENCDYINIYRDYDVRKTRMGKGYRQHYCHIPRTEPLATVDCFEQKIFYSKERLPRARGSRNKIGVLYFKDLQDFCKRLERNLFRHFGIVGSDYKMFKVSELGETYLRPHFHLLLHIKKKDMDAFYDAIRASWPFDNQNLRRQIEVARSPSSYVSKYLCSGTRIPQLFETRPFRPKASFSKGYGLANPSFSLPSILNGIERGSLMYTVLRNNQESPYVSLFYPKYLIDRYFLKFKGFSRLTSSEVFNLVRFPSLIYSFGKRLGYFMDDDDSKDDYSIFRRCINLRFDRFCRESGFNYPVNVMRWWFAYYFSKVWTTWNSNIYRCQFDKPLNEQDMLELYDNLDEIREKYQDKRIPLQTDLADLILKYPKIGNPNFHRTNLIRTAQLELDYFTHVKRKKTINHIYRRQGMYI